MLQSYIVQIPAKARAIADRQWQGAFHRPDLRGDQFCVLEDAVALPRGQRALVGTRRISGG
jgi:hypothetical protein